MKAIWNIFSDFFSKIFFCITTESGIDFVLYTG